ncbi:hypothetical protein KP78_09700 [Jeotgalibacillus soli]|uniref:Uncharacterized protein n=1 Tax=Jeotgalibacillus soli TaxID=889306 RepID=A0A0C2VKV7_9BACL|nr:hypothetical protein KP78_09700 [Jeotgalibacillus soli]
MKGLIRNLIRFGPIIYPIVKKFLNKRKSSNASKPSSY